MSDPNGDAITITGTVPSGFTIVGTTLQYNGVVATGTWTGIQLTATANGKSAISPSFTITVADAPASTGFFAGWTTAKPAAAYYAADNDTGWPYEGKQARFGVHPDGRSYFIGGDTPMSGDQRIWSVNPSTWNTSTPNSGWRLEHKEWPETGNYFPVHQDCNAIAWDSKRRVFWVMAGYNYPYSGTSAPNWGGPAGVIGFKNVVAKFDPSKPQGTQWTPTSVPMVEQAASSGIGGGENAGPAFYDPVLDLVFHGNTRAWTTRIHAFDPGVPDYVFEARLNQPDLAIDQSGEFGQALAIDWVNRYLWMIWVTTNNTEARIYRVTLPSTRTGLPTDGSIIDWTSNAVKVWENPGHDLLGFTGMIEPNRKKMHAWRRGPKSSMVTGASQDWSGGATGICGRPEIGTGSYGSPNTGVVVDLMTGAEEYAQLPLGTYPDGQGWHILSANWFDPRGYLIYGAAANGVESTALRASVNHYIARRTVAPDWVAPLTLHQWTEVPGSKASIHLPAALRSLWSGSEASGGRGCPLGGNGDENPWMFSGAAFRSRDSMMLYHGGGGAGGGRANGILAFSLNKSAAELAAGGGWSIPLPPTPASLCLPYGGSGAFEFNRTSAGAADSLFNGQKTPVAVHAYQACIYLDAEDMWLRMAAQMVWSNDQGNFVNLHGFKFSELDKPAGSRLWSLYAKSSWTEITSEQPGGKMCVQNPWTGDTFMKSGDSAPYYGRLWRRAKDYWVAGGSGWAIDPYAIGNRRPMAFDPKFNVTVHTGKRSDSGFEPILINWDADTPVYYQRSSGTAWTGTGAAAFNGSDCPWAWDGDQQVWWALDFREYETYDWSLFKIRLTSIDPPTFDVVRVPVSGTPQLDAGQVTGMSNRFKYVPELGGLVVSHGYGASHYFIRTIQKV